MLKLITPTNQHIKDKIVGMYGTVTRITCEGISVLIDGKENKASQYGIYWFHEDEIEIINDESEEKEMENFKYVAIVNLMEDFYKRDYAFALYDRDIVYEGAVVVVNARKKDNRVLGIVKEIIPVESYDGVKITAEVVGVVNMDGYIAREEEKIRLEELAKKKAAIEKELEAEISRRKSIEYYEEMAAKYSDNPKLAELVAELRKLDV